MTVQWQFKEILSGHGIQNASELVSAMREILGIAITRQAALKLMNQQPVMLRVETAQYFCDLLQIPLSHFFEITPNPQNKNPSQIIKPYGKQLHPKQALMANPDFFL